MREESIPLAVRRPGPEEIAWAKKVLAGSVGKEWLSWPEVYARETTLVGEYPKTVDVRLQALRIGDLGIAAMPCEVFGETGLAIKAQSPHRRTFIIELANGYDGYLPTPEQHELGGYETWRARSSCIEIDAEPKIRTLALKLLQQVAGT